MNDAGTVRYLLGDHLGSTTITADTSGNRVAEVLYKAWGENRYTFSTTPTTFRYTGQRQESGLGGTDGLYFYNARWYDPTLGRFAQADTIVPEPDNPQGLNRFSYTINNPLRYIDPTGHCGGDFNSEAGNVDAQKYSDCVALREKLATLYNIGISGIWRLLEMRYLEEALGKAADFVGGADQLISVFRDALKNEKATVDKITIVRRPGTGAGWCGSCGTVRLGSDIFAPNNVERYAGMNPSELGLDNRDSTAVGIILHEFAHVLTSARFETLYEYRSRRKWWPGEMPPSPRDGRPSIDKRHPDEDIADALSVYMNTSGNAILTMLD
jgi:RHS repeat-associated protein